ncbi:MAG: choice-of-anchor J domain-containing protein [Candidatus Cyclobacteriaceae bacterium M3_2C_046]
MILFFVTGWFQLKGQNRCATEERHQLLQKQFPSLQNHKQFERWLEEKKEERINRLQAFGTREEETTIILPVVVHVIHNGEPYGEGSNITDEQIISQIEVLNADYGRLNKDTINTPEYFKPVAASLGIQFVLAKRDPTGLLTNGIVRKAGSRTIWHWSNDDAELKSLSYWPAEDYINIWVVNELTNNYLAYATYPVTNLQGITEPNFNRLLDGLVTGYKYFGSKDYGNFPLESPFEYGRTITHEMGHYLGLRHTWGDGGCSVDDYCEDTPQSSENYNSECPQAPVSCGSEDMFQNYMYYTSDACMNIFTKCQKARMLAVLENSPRRKSLLTSMGAIPPAGFNYDLSAARILSPSIISCENDLFPQIEVVNTGLEVINNFMISYQISGFSKDTLEYSDINLAKGETFIISLPQVNLGSGNFDFNFNILEVEGDEDFELSNNSLNLSFSVNDFDDFIPYKERFQNEELDQLHWSVINPNKDTTWQIASASGNGSDNLSAYIDNFNYTSIGTEDWLISPNLDFKFGTAPTMWFKLSYGYRTDRNDILKILVSTDCGNTFPFVVYEKLGQEYSSQNSQEYWEPSTPQDWKLEKVDLSQFAGEENVRVAFVSTNGNGNVLYLDDIEFYLEDGPSPALIEDNSFKIYPNPTFNNEFNVSFHLQERDDVYVNVYDTYGKILFSQLFPNTLNQTYHLTLENYAKGIYMVEIRGTKVNRIKNIVLY